MTAEEKAAIARVELVAQATNKLLVETVVPQLAALTSRIEHPSPLDCVMRPEIERLREDVTKKEDAQAIVNTEIFKRLNALEIAWAKVCAVAAAISVVFSFGGKLLLEALGRAIHLHPK